MNFSFFLRVTLAVLVYYLRVLHYRNWRSNQSSQDVLLSVSCIIIKRNVFKNSTNFRERSLNKFLRVKSFWIKSHGSADTTPTLLYVHIISSALWFKTSFRNLRPNSTHILVGEARTKDKSLTDISIYRHKSPKTK
jgi:hypothetical protein